MNPRRAFVALIAWALLTACSTSGRDLREPSGQTLPPGLSAATTTTPTPGTPVEGLNGFAMQSPEFAADGALPADIGAQTGNRSPALSWSNTPESAAELALVVTDETGGVIYWLVTGILTTDMDLPANDVPMEGVEHLSTAGPDGWSGPIVPAGGTAQVVFALYALNDPVVALPGETSHALRERVIDASFATATIRGTLAG